MARGGETSYKRGTRDTVRLKKKSSDESDEDYMFSDKEEFDESEDEYCSSLADDESEESLGESAEDKEQMKKKNKKVFRPRGQKGPQRKTKKNNGFVKTGKKNVAYSEEDDFGDDDKPRKKARFSSTKNYAESSGSKPRKKARVSYREEEEDGDYHDSDCNDDEEFDDSDDDEEFTPDEVDDSDDDEEFSLDEVDGLDDDAELTVSKTSKVVRSSVQKTRNAKGRKRKRNAKALKRTRRKKPIKKKAAKRKRTSKSNHGQRRTGKKVIVDSDSDFVRSEPFDYEYTMSEEEREQIKEASELCTTLNTNLKDSSSLKAIEENEIVPTRRKRQIRKGKEKVLDVKIEVGKQVCGVCLSEEEKKTVRGILNCCSHFFCFACILEWSKVESRCPLCKQRFATITRTARTDGRHDLRDAVVTVPERDQIYQPSEEELMGYLDPYESFVCTECQQGGDEGFMLLCDICDSPAHTYCVGLGREIPEGNWYCDGCRPTRGGCMPTCDVCMTAGHASPNAQALNPTSDNVFNNHSSIGSAPVDTPRVTFDLNELYVPETPLSQATVHSPSPRQYVIYSQALTLHERRRVHRHVHQLLNPISRQSDRSDGVGTVSETTLFGSRIVLNGEIEPQSNYSQERLPNYTTTSSLYGGELRIRSLRGQVAQNQASTSTNHSFDEVSNSDFFGMNESSGQGSGHQQLHSYSSRPDTGTNNVLPYQIRDSSLSSLGKEQVQSMVKSHLKGLSRNIDIGYNTFKQIARTSTHTILAACGLEHRHNEVYPIGLRPLVCNHLERSASMQTCLFEGQCTSCFDWFVRNVVKEITCTQVPHLSMD